MPRHDARPPGRTGTTETRPGPRAAPGQPATPTNAVLFRTDEEIMTDVTVFGFQRSTFVNIVRLVLQHKNVPFAFHDLEPEMGAPSHLALHPFDRVPILRHGDFTVYETCAIVAYVDEAFDGPRLTPQDLRQ